MRTSGDLYSRAETAPALPFVPSVAEKKAILKEYTAMMIDQRLEALTHSVGLLAHMHGDNEAKYEQRFKELKSLMERIVSAQEKLGSVQETLGGIIVDPERRL